MSNGSFIDDALAYVEPPELAPAFGEAPPTRFEAAPIDPQATSLSDILRERAEGRVSAPAESPSIISSVLKAITAVGAATAGLLFRNSTSPGNRPRPTQSIGERLAGTTQSTPITTQIPITAIVLIVVGILLIAMIGRK